MTIKITYEFKDEDEVRAFFESRNAEPVREPMKPEDYVHTISSAEPEPTDTVEPTRADTDDDGMPYDEMVHADPPSFTEKGLWRAMRGNADEAKAARAAFKAGGGDVEPPADLETRDAPAAPAAPGAAPSAPAAPTARASAPAPVTIEALFGKITDMLESGALERATLFDLYRDTTGLTAGDEEIPALAGSVYQTNETARASLMAELDAI